MSTISEQEFIRTYLAPLASNYRSSYGLQDDAAHFQFEQGIDTIVSSDMLVSGRHFFDDANPYDLGFKCLSVNVSDILAKGGTPRFFNLNLALPKVKAVHDWAAQFVAGLKAAMDHYKVQLIGGDLVGTPGPLTVSVSIFGAVAKGAYRARADAKAGDRLYVTGRLGLAALGLQLYFQDRKDAALIDGIDFSILTSEEEKAARAHLNCPLVPVDLPSLMVHVNGAMDISDGLKPDLEKLCSAAQCGATINIAAIPTLSSIKPHLADNKIVRDLILCGGDDYQILMSVAPSKCQAFEQAAENQHIDLCCIGQMTKETSSISFLDAEKKHLSVGTALFNHF